MTPADMSGGLQTVVPFFWDATYIGICYNTKLTENGILRPVLVRLSVPEEVASWANPSHV